jgi:hypothetical protein
MTELNSSQSENMKEAKLPQRDWVLLPALALLTMAVLIAATELTARHKFSDAETGLAPCLVLNDSSTGVRGVPNSRCRAKGKESAWTEYQFNNCGHRAGMECGSKDPGSYRIVMTGSSIAMGLFVPREESIAGLLPAELSSVTGRKVELYNTSIGAAYGGAPRSVALRFNEVLAARPDMVLWILTPWDLDHASDLRPQGDFLRAAGDGASTPATAASFSSSTLQRLAARVGAESAAASLYQDLKNFRFRVLLTHYLYESQSLYVKSYLMNGDDMVGFLRADWGPEWKEQLNRFDGYAAEIAARSKAAGVPLVVVLVPNRAQAAMISMGEWPQGYDPYKIDDELRASIVSHGGIYVDIFPDFRGVANPQEHYMPVDGHPDAQGHAMISKLIARELTGGQIPTLRAVVVPDAALAGSK